MANNVNDPKVSSPDAPQEQKKHTVRLGPNLNFAASEAYNLLRTNITYAFADQEEGRIIGLTSPNPQEGKSFTSINLAYALATADNRVLLIDCDMRRPSIAEKLGEVGTPGLSNLLIGKEEGVLRDSSMSPNLKIIMAGDIPPNPSELLGSERMQKLLQLFSENYDYVILDLPPVTAVSDPIVVSKYLDGMIVVLKHQHTRRGDVTETIRQLRYAKVHILGFVYNSYSSRKGYYSKKYNNKYYRGKGYGYGYGYRSNKPASQAKK